MTRDEAAMIAHIDSLLTREPPLQKCIEQRSGNVREPHPDPDQEQVESWMDNVIAGRPARSSPHQKRSDYLTPDEVYEFAKRK